LAPATSATAAASALARFDGLETTPDRLRVPAEALARMESLARALIAKAR